MARGRKRKVPVVDEEKENEDQSLDTQQSNTSINSTISNGPMYTIMSNVQLNETFHKKYVAEMKQLYNKMDHDAFVFTFIKMLKSAMEAEETNKFAYTTMLFCAKVCIMFEGEETHPLLIDTCNWLMTTISNNPHIRFRLCQFVNMILNALGQEAAMDDAICDRIMEYMMERLRDMAPNVRVQAILAMQRLQVPDNPNDPVLRAYQFHLCADPSPRVRQAVITCMGRNYHTVPYILERLWDIDEKVRRHTYLHMSSYPVRSYKVSQRLSLLEQGLTDRSDAVKKVVVTIMLQQWIESYQKNFISLISALKLDSTETEVERFRKITKQTLMQIFKKQSKEDLLACLTFEEEGEFHRCVPHEKLTLEIAMYWQCLSEYLQQEIAEEYDMVLPELSAFCFYVEYYCRSQKSEMDKFEMMDFQYTLLSLVEILYSYDLGDEIGRGNLQRLLMYLLKDCVVEEKVIEKVVRCAENLITDQNTRMQFFVEIVQDICGLNNTQNDLLQDRELLANSTDAALKLKVTSLKVKIMDLQEQENNYVTHKDYVRAHQITEEKAAATEEYNNLLKPLLEQHAASSSLVSLPSMQLSKVIKNESIMKGLQITYHMVVSSKIRSLNPSVAKLYNDFICRHLGSNQISIRDWALQCGAAFSMLYESISKDVFDELYLQFFKNHNIRIWETSITCIFQLLDRYGIDNFVVKEQQDKVKKTGRQLYNTLEFIDADEDANATAAGQGVGVIHLMSHFLDTCDDACIMSALVSGFCNLILKGFIKNHDIIEKLLLRYFNPVTDVTINQILGAFLENLVKFKMHSLLEPCLMPTVHSVLSAPYDSPLQELRPDTITRFIIDSTRQEPNNPNPVNVVHNKIAQNFVQEMLSNISNKELCKLLAKELLTLDVCVMHNSDLKHELTENVDKLIKSEFDPKTLKNIIDFKGVLEGVINPAPKRNENGEESDEEDEEVTAASTQITNTQSESALTSTEPVDTSSQTLTETVVPSEPTCTEDTLTEQNQISNSNVETQRPTDISPKSQRRKRSPDGKNVTPTTFGAENTVGHRYLRRSMNLSVAGTSNSESEETGPSRPAKIRIEARIDSDKKKQSQESNIEKRKSHPITSRAKRNLKYASSTTTVDTQSESEVETTNRNVRSTRNNTKKQSALPIITETNEKDKTPIRNTRNKKQTETSTNDELSQSSTIVSDTEEELNDSEIIAASPVAQKSPRLTVSRLRRINTSYSTRSRHKDGEPEISATSPKTSSNNSATSSSDSTPLRNGNKRAHRESSDKNGSPARKLSRTESPNRKSPSKETPNRKKSPNRMTTKTRQGEGDQAEHTPEKSPSSSSSKENTNLSNVSAPSVLTMTNIATDEEADIEMSSQSTTSPKRKNLKRKSDEVVEKNYIARGTRSAQRIQRMENTVLTRKRLSLEAAKSGRAVNLSQLLNNRRPSKIPIRNKSQTSKISQSSSENASSSGSSTEDGSRSRLPKRTALSSKIMRINSTQNKADESQASRPSRRKQNI